MFIFERDHRRRAAVAPVEYDCDLTDALVKLNEVANGEIQEWSFSNPTPCERKRSRGNITMIYYNISFVLPSYLYVFPCVSKIWRINGGKPKLPLRLSRNDV